MATASKSKATGFQVWCPHCGDREASVVLDLNDLTLIECSSCSETFSPGEALELAQAEARRWARVVSWIEMAADVAE